jgi:hypothetical protein
MYRVAQIDYAHQILQSNLKVWFEAQISPSILRHCYIKMFRYASFVLLAFLCRIGFGY